MKKYIKELFINNEAARFVGIGAINLIFGYVFGIIFLISLPFHYAISVLLASILAVIFNYFSNSKFVFKSDYSSKKASLFFLNYVLIYCLNILLMSLTIEMLNFTKVQAYLFAMPFLVATTFFIQKKLIFKTP